VQLIFYRPMIVDYLAESVCPGILTADVIPVSYCRFPANLPFAPILNYGFYLLPLLLPAEKRNIADIADTPAL